MRIGTNALVRMLRAVVICPSSIDLPILHGDPRYSFLILITRTPPPLAVSNFRIAAGILNFRSLPL